MGVRLPHRASVRGGGSVLSMCATWACEDLGVNIAEAGGSLTQPSLLGDTSTSRCPASTAHTRQSRPDSGLGLVCATVADLGLDIAVEAKKQLDAARKDSVGSFRKGSSSKQSCKPPKIPKNGSSSTWAWMSQWRPRRSLTQRACPPRTWLRVQSVGCRV